MVGCLPIGVGQGEGVPRPDDKSQARGFGLLSESSRVGERAYDLSASALGHTARSGQGQSLWIALPLASTALTSRQLLVVDATTTGSESI